MQNEAEKTFVKMALGIGLVSALVTGALPYVLETANNDGSLNIASLVLYSVSALTTASALGSAGAVAFGRAKN